MMLYVLTIMIFLVTLGLSTSAFYFLFVAPAARKRIRTRLAAIQQSSMEPTANPEVDLLRQQVLSQFPSINRFLLQLPLANRVFIFMQQAATEVTIASLLLISFSLAFFVFLLALLFNIAMVLAGILAVLAGAIPFVVVAWKRRRRFAKFQEMFPDAIDMLARAVRAGHAFTTGLELIAREMPEPIAGEFRTTFEQQNFGMPIREALHNLTVRMPLQDVRFFVSALQIQRDSGGNLAEILDNLSYVIRERFKLLRQVQVYTAEGRLTLYILSAMPPIFGVLMYLVNPKYISRLFSDPIGHKALGIALVLQIVGYLVIRRIVRIKI